jgi:hypothetical protein
MANTLTSMIPAVYEALDVVSREMVGMIPAVRSDFDASRAAVGQSIIFPVTVARAAVATAPAYIGPASVDTSAPGTTVTISKSYGVQVTLNGEETKGLGGSKAIFIRDEFAQAMRTLVNLIEVDLCTIGKENASRAYGTAGTAPFGTAADLSAMAGVGQILDDNGAPNGQRQLVLNSAAKANLLAKQANLFNSGSEIFKRGLATEMGGFQLGYSGGLTLHTKGTGTGYLVNLTAGYAVGTKTMVVDTGANTLVKGDILTNDKTGRDTNKYVVATAYGSTTTTLTIAAPGLRVAAVNNDPLNLGANYTPNLAFDKNAIWLATRAPAVPDGGDAAVDATIVVDPVSGLAFEVREYRQYRQVTFEVAIAWGYAAVKTEHIAILLG